MEAIYNCNLTLLENLNKQIFQSTFGIRSQEMTRMFGVLLCITNFLLAVTSVNAVMCCCSGIVMPTMQCYDDPGHCSFTDKCGQHASSSDNKVPKWSATYNMSESTVMMPCNYSGLYDFDAYPNLAKFGLVDYDW